MPRLAKWAGFVFGFGTFFVLMGLVLYFRQGWYPAGWSEFTGRIFLCCVPHFPAGFGTSNLHTITFGMFFYGSIFIAVGVSILAVQRFSIKRTKLDLGR